MDAIPAHHVILMNTELSSIGYGLWLIHHILKSVNGTSFRLIIVLLLLTGILAWIWQEVSSTSVEFFSLSLRFQFHFVLVKLIWLHEYVMWSLQTNEEFTEGWVGSIELLEDHPKEIIMIIITVITWKKKKNGSSFSGSLHSTPT